MSILMSGQVCEFANQAPAVRQRRAHPPRPLPANKTIQCIELPRARSHRVQEDVRILGDLEPRIDAPQLARIVHRPGEGRAELSMRGTPRDDPGAEWTRVVERNFEVRAPRRRRLRLRAEYRLDLRALQKVQHPFRNDDGRPSGIPWQAGEEVRESVISPAMILPASSLCEEPAANRNHVGQIDIEPHEAAVVRPGQFFEAGVEPASEIDAQSVRVAFEKPAHRLREPLRSKQHRAHFVGVEIKAPRVDVKLAKNLDPSRGRCSEVPVRQSMRAPSPPASRA